MIVAKQKIQSMCFDVHINFETNSLNVQDLIKKIHRRLKKHLQLPNKKSKIRLRSNKSWNKNRIIAIREEIKTGNMFKR